MGDAARFSNVNQSNPWGARTFSGTPGESDYRVDTTLNPADQKRLDFTRHIQNGLLSIITGGQGGGGMGKAGKPGKPQAMPPMQMGQGQGPAMPPMQVAPMGQAGPSMAGPPGAQEQMGSGPQMPQVVQRPARPVGPTQATAATPSTQEAIMAQILQRQLRQ